MKTILITGGGGFIGSQVVRRFLRAGSKIVVYDDFSYGKREFLGVDGDVWIVEGDINDTDKLRHTISLYRPAWVCHLAAIHFIPHCNAHPTEALKVNTVGTESVLSACRSDHVEKVVVASSAAVYGVNDGANIEGETPAKPIDIYGLSKLFAESLAERCNRDTGITTVSLRFFNAIGPRETNPHVLPHICESIRQGDCISLGNVEPRRDYIHTSDVAEAVYAVCEGDIRGHEVFNIGSGNEYSVTDMVEMLGEILNRKLTIEQDPGRKRKTERMHLLASISKIKDAIGWVPRITFREGLLDVVKYYNLERRLSEAAI